MSLPRALRRAGQPLRAARTAAGFVPGVAAGLAALAAAAWLARLGAAGPAVLVLLAWLALAAALAAAVIRAMRVRRQLGPAGIAIRLERGGAWRRGALSMLLAPLAPGTSESLHDAATDAEVRRVADTGVLALAPATQTAWRQVTRWVGWSIGVLLLLVAARPAEATRGLLLRPLAAWRALVAPVGLTTSTPIVDRGASATLEVVALGQREATLLTRAPGEAWRRQTVVLDATGHATVETEPLHADLVARVEAAGRRSPEVRVAIRVPAFVGALVLRATYPAYLALEDETLPIDGDTLLVPEGTLLSVSGESTTPLDRGALSGGGQDLALAIDGGQFSGRFTPTRDATWVLQLTPSQGGTLEGLPPPLPIRVIADSAPSVTVPVPGVDTVAPPSHRLPVVVGLVDDHGLTGAHLELRRGTGAVVQMPLELGEASDRALLTAVIDIDALGAEPGDTVFYSAVATDNAPRPRLGRSREFRIVVPTEAEERAARVAATAQAATGLDSLVEAARAAQRAAEDLAQERQRGGSGATESGQGETMTAEAARRAEQVAQAQEQVQRQLDAMRQQVAELEQAAEREGPVDSALAGDLREIRALLDKAMTPALREAMDRLRESLQNLDAQGTRDAMRDLAAEQQRMREALERARELFDRAALETELATLAEEANDLRDAQQAMAAQLAADSAAGARAEDALAARADSLASSLEAAAERSPAEASAEGLREAAEQSRQAGDQMRSAAQSARQGKRQQAQQQAKAAGEMLEPLGDQIAEQREQMQEAMREEVLADLDRLLGETTRALGRQYVVAESFRRGALVGPLRAEETMLEEATAKLLQQVITVAGKNALISPRISVALAGARDGLRAAIEASSSAAPSLGLASDRAGDAVDMLAVAAYALLQSRRNVEGSESGSGLEEAMQQMMQMAGQQNAAADQGQSMQQQGAEPGMGELMQLAMQQRAIAQQLERMRAQGQIPGAGELAREAQDLARQIEAGRLSPETVARQQKLFRRMLDAGRSLEGEQDEQSSERQGEGAQPGELARPGALDPRLRQGPAFELPGWDELQRLDPDDRRRVLDYFRRLTEARTP